MKVQKQQVGRQVFTILAVGMALSFATKAWAQTTPSLAPVEKAAADLIQTGVLGTMLVIVMFVAWKLYQRVEAMQTAATATAEKTAATASTVAETHRREILALTSEQSKLLAENNLLTKRQIDLMEKVVERAEA